MAMLKRRSFALLPSSAPSVPASLLPPSSSSSAAAARTVDASVSLHCIFRPQVLAFPCAPSSSLTFPASASSARHRSVSTVNSGTRNDEEEDDGGDEEDDDDDGDERLLSLRCHDALSEEQARAVESDQKCVRVVAGPGSGKTRVLTHRVVHLISRCGVSPHNILFVTFTNKAAQELRERLEQLFGSQTAKQLMVGTFHSICSKILRWHPCAGIDRNFVIYDEKDSERVVKEILEACPKQVVAMNKQVSKISTAESFSQLKNKPQKNKQKIPPVSAPNVGTVHKSLRSARLHLMKCFLNNKRQRAPPKLPRHLREADFAMARLYEETLRRSNAVDFDDLIHLVVRMLHSDQKLQEVCEDRWKYILVDEFQDTDLLQYELIRLLALKNQNLFVVGDIDQAIFGWRGADLSHMQLELEKDFPSIVTFQLRENYRSSSSILKAASIILKYSQYNRKIGSLHALSLIPVKGYKAVPINIGEFENARVEASFVVREMEKLVEQGEASWGSFALLYRTRAQGFELERALAKAWIPFQVYGAVPFYSHKEIKVLTAYLQLIANLGNEVALGYCINIPPRGVGEKSIEILKNWASNRNLSLPTAMEKIYTESLTHKDLGLRPKARNGIFSFLEVIHHLRAVCNEVSVSKLLSVIIEKLSFQSYIKALSKDEIEVRQRIERIQQFLSAAEVSEKRNGVGYQALLCFLEDLALLTNQEGNQDIDRTTSQRSKVTLSTLHSAKGLEFDRVFVVGVSDRVLPLEECDPDEERRLFYVGITRARKQLFLTYSCEPAPWQQSGPNRLSTFVKELIHELPQQYLNFCSVVGGREDLY